MKSLCRIFYRWVVKWATYLHVPSDKLLHFLCAMALMIATSLLTNLCIGYGVTMAVSIGKEIYDTHKTNPTGFSIGDLMADLLGVIVGMVVAIIVA